MRDKIKRSSGLIILEEKLKLIQDYAQLVLTELEGTQSHIPRLVALADQLCIRKWKYFRIPNIIPYGRLVVPEDSFSDFSKAKQENYQELSEQSQVVNPYFQRLNKSLHQVNQQGMQWVYTYKDLEKGETQSERQRDAGLKKIHNLFLFGEPNPQVDRDYIYALANQLPDETKVEHDQDHISSLAVTYIAGSLTQDINDLQQMIQKIIETPFP